MSLKILDVIWFSGKNTIGIVVCENKIGERKFYIGVGDGLNAEQDSEKIKNWGSKVNPQFIKNFFERYNPSPLKPEKPKPPLPRIIREGTIGDCPECGSTTVKKFLWFGKQIGCIQSECKNYYYK